MLFIMINNKKGFQKDAVWAPSSLERGGIACGKPMATKGVRLLFSGMIFLLLSFTAFAQREEKSAPQMTIPEYITKYSEIAKAEMRRSGVPASITLAQGILESSYGNSKLATRANNHFGIKCGANWKGPTFIQDDDTEKECFRKYESVLHSYADHSNFLRGKDRYAFLFELNPKDYEGWAKGLQKAGYATNPNYATLLIRLIEERDLHRFDTEQKYKPLTKAEEEYFASVQDKYYTFNGIKTVIAQPNEMLMDMATKYDISLSSLLKYNDLHEGEYVAPGTKIYLEPKKTKGFEAFHRVEEGETMHSISQQEGIKLKTLYKKNRLPFGMEPAVGEILCLQKKCDAAPKVKTDEQIKQDIKEKIQTRVEEAVKEEKKKEVTVAEAAKELPKPEVAQEKPAALDTPKAEIETVQKPEVKTEQPPVVKETPAPTAPIKTSEVKKPKYHTVAPQETLYRVATSNGLTVEELKKLNGLTSNSISIGQKLIVGYTTETVSETVVEEKPVIAEKPVVQEKPNNKPVVEERKPIYHLVAPQETFYKIASKYGISVAELKVMNDITTNELKIGQKLLVGYEGVISTEPKYTPEPKETEEIETSPAPPAQTPSDQPTYHKVQAGETLYSIAQKYKLNVEELKTLNNLPSNDIQPGRVLKLR